MCTGLMAEERGLLARYVTGSFPCEYTLRL